MKPVKDKKDYYKRRQRYKLISGFGKFLSRSFIIMYVIMLVGAGLFGVYKFKGMVEGVPDLSEDILSNAETSLIVDVEGNTLMELGVSKVENLPLNETSEDIKKAIISVEDKRFYEHHGFDIIRLGKAVETTLRGNFGAEGGSTLTQQLAKISYLDQYDDSLTRKAQELYLAWEMEEKYSKDEILNLYINKVYMGNGVYGMRTGSKYYYGKDIHNLEPYELAVIVGTPNRPESYNPYGEEDNVKHRRDTVLYLFKENGYITEEEYEEYTSYSVYKNVISKEENQKREFENLNTVEDYLATPVNRVIDEANTLVDDLYTGGYVIETTIDVNKQEYGYNLVTKDKDGGGKIDYPSDDMLVSITVLNNKTGEIEFLEGGSRNTQTDVNGFNYATDLQRQPGSSIKPILDYAPYIEILGGNPSDTVLDAEAYYSEGIPINNYYMDYKGEMTVQRALEESRNTPAYRLMMEVGIDNAYDFANKLGMGFTEEERLESGALGGVSNANPYKMARAFSVFPNKGEYKDYTLIRAIEDNKGQLVYRNKKESDRVMSVEGTDKMNQMLRAVVTSDYGTASELDINKFIAGKTGTTNYSADEVNRYSVPDRGAPDVWFVGYDDKYTVGVWVGYEKRSGIILLEHQGIAKEIALEVWTNYIDGSNPIEGLEDTVKDNKEKNKE